MGVADHSATLAVENAVASGAKSLRKNSNPAGVSLRTEPNRNWTGWGAATLQG